MSAPDPRTARGVEPAPAYTIILEPAAASTGPRLAVIDCDVSSAPPPKAGAAIHALPRRSSPSPAWAIPPVARRHCSALTYVANAAVHPANLFVLVASILLVATHVSLAALALALALEAAFLVVLARCGFFRRGVHAGLEEQDRDAKRRERDALILQMGEGHRNELLRLEALLDDALAAFQRRASAKLGACDASGMARLTQSYIRLAIDHRACAQAVAMTNAATLHATIGSLEIASANESARTGTHFRRWLDVARRRSERWAEAHATMESIGQQLATIAELAHLVHQEALSVSNSELAAEVDAIFEDFEQREHAAREVTHIGMVDAGAPEVEHELLTA